MAKIKKNKNLINTTYGITAKAYKFSTTSTTNTEEFEFKIPEKHFDSLVGLLKMQHIKEEPNSKIRLSNKQMSKVIKHLKDDCVFEMKVNDLELTKFALLGSTKNQFLIYSDSVDYLAQLIEIKESENKIVFIPFRPNMIQSNLVIDVTS